MPCVMKQYCKSLPTHWKEHVFFNFDQKHKIYPTDIFHPSHWCGLVLTIKSPNKANLSLLWTTIGGFNSIIFFTNIIIVININFLIITPSILSTGECVIWLAVLPCPPQYPSHVLLLRTGRTILIFLTSLSLTSWLAPHFLCHKLYPNSIPHNVLKIYYCSAQRGPSSFF